MIHPSLQNLPGIGAPPPAEPKPAVASVVWKYAIDGAASWYDWPESARCTAFRAKLSTGEDAEFWLHRPALKAPAEPQACLQVFGTGHHIPPGSEVLATAFDGPFVWHLVKLAVQS